MSFLMMGSDTRAMEPTELLFWGVARRDRWFRDVAYPANVWMVVRHLKHGLMTERKPGGRFDVQNKSWEDAEEKRGAHGSHGHHARHRGGRAQSATMPSASVSEETPAIAAS